ncbi:hypothetical protein, unlikely [Trypanosoma brucei gambiense DAL972]|uniref:Uncharacterized protein n=1 Tax=Trypanosoma brucei gambiense (strain MHOM/CI/86/DAL972) TaxID=679716 RepID=C9ZNV2_TRYB9|nr:hypothetical protein, unlikely [Trypanosoma brucei gambiense DAL972]CBH11080.1 hypothetical protein, unlikely [Trypanosoma brucei gambiense DAL972]|eukprot:XP_011773367.1 hypothetical protein, unlikely [Trypanosoma brucei gambiense DAL972]
MLTILRPLPQTPPLLFLPLGQRANIFKKKLHPLAYLRKEQPLNVSPPSLLPFFFLCLFPLGAQLQIYLKRVSAGPSTTIASIQSFYCRRGDSNSTLNTVATLAPFRCISDASFTFS